jgi:hypothetical protein
MVPVPVPTFEKVMVPVPTFEKLWFRFRFRFQLYIKTIKSKFFKKNFGIFLPFCIVSCFTRKKFIIFNKVIVKCERKFFSMKVIMRLVYREDHYLLHLSATAVNNRLTIYIFLDFSGTHKLVN